MGQLTRLDNEPQTCSECPANQAGSRLVDRDHGTPPSWSVHLYERKTEPAKIHALWLTLLSMALNTASTSATTSVVAWGDNTWGQTNVPAGLTNVLMIAAGWG